MKKKYIMITGLLIAVIIIGAIVIFLKDSNKDLNTLDNFTNKANNETMQELALFINSSNDLKNDTYAYQNQYILELRNVFDKLNDNTNNLLDAMLDNADVDIDKLEENIKTDEKKLFEILDNAYNNAKSKQYKISYTALKKYIQLQNETIYKLRDVYKKEGSLTYDTYYEMLHDTHNTLTIEETNAINFLSAVDKLLEENN